MKWRIFFLFLLGFVLGGLFVGFFWMAQTVGKDMSSWGTPQESFDDAAREIIESGEYPPSPAATEFYYYIDGFQDHHVFYAYTDTPEHIRAVVKKATGKNLEELAEFQPANMTESEAYAPGSQFGKQYLTPLYDIGTIRKGRVTSESDSTGGSRLIIDTEHNRLFYMRWNT